MTYKNQFVVEVKVDGQILRIRDGAVYLPYNCEYSILLKNLNSKKASVNISIDGKDVLDNSSLIIEPLVTHELKGFLTNTTVKNCFRFIQKTKQIQEHRGDRIDDGLLRVEFAFEAPKPEPVIKKHIQEIHHYYHDDYRPPVIYNNNNDWCYGSITTRNTSKYYPINDISNVAVNTLGVSAELNTPLVDEGITVKGSEISKSYRYASIGKLEEPLVIIIALKGIHNSPGVSVQDPITVTRKLTCSSCGTKSKSSFKFCPNCGTFLE